MSDRRPRVLAISDRRLLDGASLVNWSARVSRSGVDAIQLREKDLTDREIVDLARRMRRAMSPGTRLLVNSRLDLSIAAGADGAHLPAAEVPIEPLRRRFGARPLIGRSTHELREVDEARREGADYVTFGPVYATPSKARYGPPAGVVALRQATDLGVAVLALGGVTIEHLPEIAAAGAWGIAGIRMFLDPSRLDRLVEEAGRYFTRPGS